MKKMIKFPSIVQFRETIASINRSYNFVGLDENGEAVYDHTKPKPKLKFHGTVKIHGCNAGVSCNAQSGIWAQSRENILSIEKDNAGFCFFVESKKDVFQSLFEQVIERTGVDPNKNTISIYGEWAGGNIQKGVAICNIEKSMFIFGVKISPFEVEGQEKVPAYWVDHDYLKSPDNRIYNVEDFPTFEIEVDFNFPQLSQNKFVDLTIQVENECPVAKAFGFSGTGEGIVWSHDMNGERFLMKTKGEKHSSSKVKTIASVDIDKLNSIQEFVNYAVTESRFSQAIGVIFPNNEPVDTKKLGDVIRWVVNDVLKEELDTMVGNGIEPKEVNSKISAKVREMFFQMV